VLALGSPAGALTNGQRKCQKTVATQGRVFFKKRFKALAQCHDAIDQGGLPLSTDCEIEAGTVDKLTAAAQKLGDKIGSACPDAVVASLDFGDQCAGVATAAALSDCQRAEHEAATNTLVATVYGDATPPKVCSGGAKKGLICASDGDCPSSTCVLYQSARTCSGGTSNGNPCTDDAGCPSGACVLAADQQQCTAALAKALGKLADKRQKILQTCKKKIAKGKLPLTTDCVAAGQGDLDAAFSATLATIDADCSSAVTGTLGFGGACTSETDRDSVAACGTCTVGKQADELILAQHGSSARGGTALAKQTTDTADCVGGPLSRCRANDYLLRNDRIRVVIQDLQRNLFGVGQFGGQIIDGDIVRQPSDPDRDNFEEWALSLNIEGTAHYTSITILNDGGNGGPAIIRVTGVDDLLDFVNPSSTVASFGFSLPPSADDTDLPVTVTTDYTLEPGTNYVRVETTLQNTSASPLHIFFGEYINGSGQVEMFQPGYGFGEPLVGTTCVPTQHNLCNFTGYMGVDDADGVSYGYIQQTPGSSTFTTSGVHVPQLDIEVVLALVGLAPPPFTIPPSGDPAGDSISFTRYFVVGAGNVSDVSDARNEIQCLPTGTLTGTVTAGANPAVRADIAVLGDPAKGRNLGTMPRNVVTHTRTDDQGKYSLTLPPGDYTVIANLEGSPYEGGGSTPQQDPVTINAFATSTLDIGLPATGGLQVTVEDQDNQPIAAKAMVVGFDPSPDPLNTQSVAGLINNTTGIFRDRTKDYMPFGVARSVFIGPSGTSSVIPLEPGNYQVVISHGPEYSIDKQNVTISAGVTQPVTAKVEHVVDSTGFVASDFHVHSIDSPDARVSHVDRVITMLDEGMDFFTPTDHDYRFDYQPVIDALGVSNLLGTITGEEITTFDYGHFNAWPLSIDPNQVNHGAVDFGGAAPAGQDFPAFGYYSETPASIISLAHAGAPGPNNTVQINHIHGHFGIDGGSGLAIDTGLTPPASTVPAQARRLDPSITNFFTNTFDALEIWIGDDRQGQILTNFLGQNIGDWFNLINQGIVRTGVADSDSHTRTPAWWVSRARWSPRRRTTPARSAQWPTRCPPPSTRAARSEPTGRWCASPPRPRRPARPAASRSACRRRSALPTEQWTSRSTFRARPGSSSTRSSTT
jgi:hypothetical protein